MRTGQVHPLDTLSLRLWGRTREQAHRDAICIRCGLPPDLSHREDATEWRISALCGKCFDRVMSPDPDDR